MNELKPNFTQIPNLVLDELMSELTNAEFRVLMYICRRTYGFHKESDRISYSQFEFGLIDLKNRKVLDKGCGLRSEAISKALVSLVGKQIIVREQVGQDIYYSPNFDYRSTTTSITEDKVLRLPNIQKKEKEREIKLHSSIDFLRNISDDFVSELVSKYNVGKSEVMAEADRAVNWIEANGKTYKNYGSMFRGWISRSYGLKPDKAVNPAKI